MAAIVAADAPTTTMQYDGSISSEGKFHGKGSIVYSNGEKYAGDWEHGQRHGMGCIRTRMVARMTASGTGTRSVARDGEIC